MKQVWKCDHCDKTEDLTLEALMKVHEDNCPHDIKNKACHTCDNYLYDHDGSFSVHNYCGRFLDDDKGLNGECKEWKER